MIRAVLFVVLAVMLSACATEHSNIKPKTAPTPVIQKHYATTSVTAQKSIYDKLIELKAVLANDTKTANAMWLACQKQVEYVSPVCNPPNMDNATCVTWQMKFNAEFAKVSSAWKEKCKLFSWLETGKLASGVKECEQEIGLLGDKKHMQLVDVNYLNKLYNKCSIVHKTFVANHALVKANVQKCLSEYAKTHGVPVVELP